MKQELGSSSQLCWHSRAPIWRREVCGVRKRQQAVTCGCGAPGDATSRPAGTEAPEDACSQHSPLRGLQGPQLHLEHFGKAGGKGQLQQQGRGEAQCPSHLHSCADSQPRLQRLSSTRAERKARTASLSARLFTQKRSNSTLIFSS